MRKKLRNGYVQVYTGDGKGKTTSALGLAFRAAGRGLKSYVIHFMKGGLSYGEMVAAKRLEPEITVVQMGRETFVDRENPAIEDVELARRGLELAKEVVMGGLYDLVILDEVNVALDYGLIKVEEVLQLIKDKPGHVELVLTGRAAPEGLMEAADLVTEMVERKHYYRRGITAREGIEY